MTPRPLEVADLGRRPYRDVLALQRLLREERLDGTRSHDLLLLVEHDPVYTLGRGTRPSSLPVSETLLRARGADVVEIERGGDVTWHGPGQLVGYPVFHLSAHREDLHWYLRTLENVLIRALGDLGVAAEVYPGKTGVWTGGRKIASIGIHVRRWVTLHGFAVNLDPDLAWFDQIVPCGLQGVEMTSVARELGGRGDTDLAERARAAVTARIAEAFALTPVTGSASVPMDGPETVAKPCDSGPARAPFTHG